MDGAQRECGKVTTVRSMVARRDKVMHVFFNLFCLSPQEHGYCNWIKQCRALAIWGLKAKLENSFLGNYQIYLKI